MENKFLPGMLVRARNRDWIVQSGSTADWLRLRPMGGADDEALELMPKLELTPVEPATFGMPDPNKVGPFYSAELLYNALRFQLRSGAGPFRSFGSIAVEPRSYQLVPLLMAMRQQVVRLLIADDVGIGKTIEAGLIVRELLDRGEIKRCAVLCPPHLVEQWVSELDERFNLKAEALTTGTAVRLERRVPHGKSMSDVFPFLVVSLDYVKSERHRDYFKAMNFEMIVVDEAHTCTQLGGRSTRQLRFELLKDLASDISRHMIFLTATPHSGDERGFYSLLSLLKPEFGDIGERLSQGQKTESIRRELAKYFVQRRRKDIAEWRVSGNDRTVGFPRRMTQEKSYLLSPKEKEFLEAVQEYCNGLIAKGANNQLIWYAVVALLRCVSSSPAAAVQTLQNRLAGEGKETETAESMEVEFSEPDDLEQSDVVPVMISAVDKAGQRLLELAVELRDHPEKDSKLKLLKQHVSQLVEEGFNPVVFCRYVATAHYVAEELKKLFKKKSVTVECVTGEYVPEERKARVEGLGEHEQRVLVATDCLSEGINLQQYLNAVVHYDMAWNPTRHEQREGRIDRFGQRAPEVRCLMIFGQNNPVDGFILKVILRKSNIIRQSLGVTVPVPMDKDLIQKALVEAAVFKRKSETSDQQGALWDEDYMAQLESESETAWVDALEKVQKTKTIFAQQTIHPEEIYPLWQAQQDALGSHGDVENFCREAAAGLSFRFEPLKNGLFRLPLRSVRAESILERLKDEGFTSDVEFDFNELHRSSPLVSALSEGIVDQALEGENCTVVRSAVTESEKVETVTRIVLLRLRYQMRFTYRNQTQRYLMAEEILPVAITGKKNPVWSASSDVRDLIHEPAKGNLSNAFASKQILETKEILEAGTEKLADIAEVRASELFKEHNSVKSFTAHGSVAEVKPCLPVDVMGIFVLLPAED